MLQSALKLFTLANTTPAFPDAPLPSPKEPTTRGCRSSLPARTSCGTGAACAALRGAVRSLRSAAGHKLSFQCQQSELLTLLMCIVTKLIKRVFLSSSPSFPSSFLFHCPRQPSLTVFILPRPLSLSPTGRKLAAVQMSCDPVRSAVLFWLHCVKRILAK